MKHWHGMPLTGPEGGACCPFHANVLNGEAIDKDDAAGQVQPRVAALIRLAVFQVHLRQPRVQRMLPHLRQRVGLGIGYGWSNCRGRPALSPGLARISRVIRVYAHASSGF
eukprot:CAMPEP_0198560174 /NCGR_PEP_ID=MMETSP1462-20131121/93512_1 /TAXON_ID=1333877 /ORGANISM="Brandtodinium nutriculum, Strain RCC3387" /LENGTH=110 /DNA_ID=CAMNT_0044291031 /DNA_START=37 /DNA_END=365 /DNA_ORIENTATION=+